MSSSFRTYWITQPIPPPAPTRLTPAHRPPSHHAAPAAATAGCAACRRCPPTTTPRKCARCRLMRAPAALCRAGTVSSASGHLGACLPRQIPPPTDSWTRAPTAAAGHRVPTQQRHARTPSVTRCWHRVRRRLKFHSGSRRPCLHRPTRRSARTPRRKALRSWPSMSARPRTCAVRLSAGRGAGKRYTFGEESSL